MLRKLLVENNVLLKYGLLESKIIGKDIICIEEMRRFFDAHYVGVLPRVTPLVFPSLIHARIYARIESILLPYLSSFPIREVKQRHTERKEEAYCTLMADD